MPDIDLLVSSPFCCDEGVVCIVNDVTLPESDNRSFSLWHIVSSHAATHIPCFQVDFLHTCTSFAEGSPRQLTCDAHIALLSILALHALAAHARLYFRAKLQRLITCSVMRIMLSLVFLRCLLLLYMHVCISAPVLYA